MAESRRGCGWRKIGATYLVGGGEMRPCGRFPFPLHVCPTCNGGIKQSRGWTWIRPAALFADLAACRFDSFGCRSCPMSDPAYLADAKGRCGLLWIGTGFYATPLDFSRESNKLGVCRRIAAIPKGVEVGKTWIVLAHPKAIVTPHAAPAPGVFSAFLLTAIERCVSNDQYTDVEAMEALQKKGITPVPLPDLPRHRGTVYKDEDQLSLDVA